MSWGKGCTTCYMYSAPGGDLSSKCVYAIGPCSIEIQKKRPVCRTQSTQFPRGGSCSIPLPTKTLRIYILFIFAQRKANKNLSAAGVLLSLLFLSVLSHEKKEQNHSTARKATPRALAHLAQKKNMMTHGPVLPSARFHRAIATSAKGRHLYTWKVGLRSRTQTTCTCGSPS